MLICFLKDSGESDAEVQVQKFSDRVWLHHDGSAVILRQMVITVLKDSPVAIHNISMLVPREAKAVTCESITDKALDPDYYWHTKLLAGYVRKDPSKRIVRFDGIENARVPLQVTCSIMPAGQHSEAAIIDLNLNEDVNPGESVAVLLKVGVAGVISKEELANNPDNLPFSLSYLSRGGCSGAVLKQCDVVNREVEVLPILSMEKRSGGFDVHVIPPKGTHISPDPTSHSATGRIDHTIDGGATDAVRTRCWRLRFNVPPIAPAKADGGMYVAGTMLRDDMALASARQKRQTWVVEIIALAIALLALTIGVISFLDIKHVKRDISSQKVSGKAVPENKMNQEGR